MSRAVEDDALPQMGIHALEWNGKEWLIGGNTMKVFEDGFTPHPLLVKYFRSFTDISSQLDIEDTIIDRISWNGEYFLICYSFHEYGGLIRYDGQIHDVPLPGEPLSLRVTTLDWNGEYWLIGSSYVGYGYLVKYDGVTVAEVSSSPFSGVTSVTWMKNSWFISGINPDRVDILMNYDGNTCTEIEKPDFVGPITTSRWNGEYILLESEGNLIQFDGVHFVDTGFNSQVSSFDWNGEYWLLGGGKGMLTTYDGSVFTDLTGEAGISGRIQAIGWNGEYWLLGDSTGVLKMYDGEEFTDLTSPFKDAVHFSLEPEGVVEEEANTCGTGGIVIILLTISLSYFLVKKKYQ